METVQQRQKRIGDIVNTTLTVRGPERNVWFGAAVGYLHAMEKKGQPATKEALAEKLKEGLPALQAVVEEIKTPKVAREKLIAAWQPVLAQNQLPKTIHVAPRPQPKWILGMAVSDSGMNGEQAQKAATEIGCLVLYDKASKRHCFTHQGLVAETNSSDRKSITEGLYKALQQSPLGGIKAQLAERGFTEQTCTVINIQPEVNLDNIKRTISVSRLAVQDIQDRLERVLKPPYCKTVGSPSLGGRTFEMEVFQTGGFLFKETTPGAAAPLQVAGHPKGAIEMVGEPIAALKAAMLHHGHDLDDIDDEEFEDVEPDKVTQEVDDADPDPDDEGPGESDDADRGFSWDRGPEL